MVYSINNRRDDLWHSIHACGTREDLDYSQAKMAAALRLYKTTYARYESGERDIPLSVAIKIAVYHHVTLDYLCGLSDKKTADS